MMLWVPPPPTSLSKEAVHNLLVRGFIPPSERSLRILHLQDLYTVEQLADAAFRGILHAYPDRVQEEVSVLFCRLGPALNELSETEHERRERIARLDWTSTVIGRAINPQEVARLSGVDLRLLRCPWPVIHIAWTLGAVDALDAATLDRELVVHVKTSGPGRLEMLRIAVTRAAQGDVEPDNSMRVPDYLSARHSVAGRSLSISELARLGHEAVADLSLPWRAARAKTALHVETCLDLAAVLDRQVVFRAGFGKATFQALRRALAERLDPPPA